MKVLLVKDCGNSKRVDLNGLHTNLTGPLELGWCSSLFKWIEVGAITNHSGDITLPSKSPRPACGTLTHFLASFWVSYWRMSRTGLIYLKWYGQKKKKRVTQLSLCRYITQLLKEDSFIGGGFQVPAHTGKQSPACSRYINIIRWVCSVKMTYKYQPPLANIYRTKRLRKLIFKEGSLASCRAY